MKRLLSCFLILIAFLSSCCSKVDCGIASVPLMGLRLLDFDLADVDTIYTTGYTIGSDFTEVARAERMDTVQDDYYVNEKVFYLKSKTEPAPFYPALEWKIYIPALNRTLYLSDYGYTYTTCGKCFLKKSTKERVLSTCKLEGNQQDVYNLQVNK